MADFRTLDDFDAKGKTVLLRIDVNATIIGGKVQDSERFTAHSQTVRELAKKGAKIVILAHQGRAGDADFTTLEQHAQILGKHCRKSIKYVSDVLGENAQNHIKKLKEGKIIMLENTRFLAEETLDKNFSQTLFVKMLSPLCDVFVNDAFSASHRSQTSLVGFCETLPSYAGRVMQKEFESISKALSGMERPNVYVLGGAKPDDVFKLMKRALENGSVDLILTSGVIGELCLVAKGINLGSKRAWLKEKGFDALLPEVQKLVQAHGGKIETPVDVAFADKDGIRVEIPVDEIAQLNGQIFDIGSKTAKRYADALKGAKTVYVKGPLGAFEQPAFELGTHTVFKAIESSKAFTLAGGGHTLVAMEKFGVNKKKISHLSIAGGALVAMLQGEPLPAVEALKKAKK